MPQHKARKACDFCYRRRIKCDAQKPRCSNCILHDSICAFGATSRKARARHQESGEDIGVLRSQVERLESSLGLALKRIEELESLVPKWDEALDVPAASAGADDLDEYEVDFAEKELPDARMELPPLPEALSATEAYLTTLNVVLPLFHPGRLLQLIKSWYTSSGPRERTTWAAINVVLALAHRLIQPDEATLSEGAAYYLHNAQTVLSEVIMGGADLLNVQILIGMVILFQGMQDLKPATMLIAIALRLAHELGLHTRRAEYPDTSQVLERDRVFWIAYILDRDISLRTGQPPVQREADIDLEWPSAEPEDGAGTVTNADGTFPFNFLRCRVRLARIQGEVYDFIVATRAGTMDNYQRDENIARLNRMLDDWISSIPPPFRPSSVVHTGQPKLCRSFAVLYSTHLACRTQVYRADAMALPWMQSLRTFGRTVTQQGHTVPVPLPTPSLQDWEKLVDETRGFMDLFWGVERRDQAFIWMTACTYISGSVCLTANIMFEPCHASMEHDLALVNLSIALLEDLIQQTEHQPLKDLRDACEELLRYACALSPMVDV
ncbi:Fungal specific transcription factor domain-containing protein [Cladophialophora immunda]|nr:Fungal specific transcription factor domain-containing protein [Cladophialophora immunda]